MIQTINVTELEATAAAEDYLVLLPIGDLDVARRLLPLAGAIAQQRSGHVLALGVVVVEEGLPLSEGVLETRRIRAALDADPAFNQEEGVLIRPAVTVAHSVADGIRNIAKEHRARLIVVGWQEDRSSPERLFGPPIDSLLVDPPCDVAVVRLAGDGRWQRVLLPVRGGPHTPLACETALALAERDDAAITILYASDPRQFDDGVVRESLKSLGTMPRVDRWLERSIPAETAILAEAPDHQLIILGVAGRQNDPEAPVGALADNVLRKTAATVVLVRHRLAAAEEEAQQAWQRRRDLSETVDRWFAENTFSSAEFEDLGRLVALKQQQGVTISLGLPALNEEATVGPIIETIQKTLIAGAPLIDELVLIDSGSEDRTREIARSLGVPVHVHQQVLRQYGSFEGKGEALWKSLYVLNGDIIAWVDTDVRDFHPRLVYGILGPLLRESRLMFCKGFYRRPIRHGETISNDGGGRVTELTARPLLNLFYPELSGMVQPLSGEYAGRRKAFESIPFFTGYGVETGMLLDLLERFGLGALAQSDLRQRIHRNQELIPLSKMAFAIIQVIIQRLESRQRVQLLEPVNQSMKLIRYAANEGFHLEVRGIRDHERPPMIKIPEYRSRRAAAG